MLLVLLAACDGSDKDVGPGDTDADTDTDSDTDTDTDSDTDTDTDTDTDVVVDCGVTLDAPAEGLCDATAGASGEIVLRGTVLGPAEAWRGGAVVVDATGTITCAGCDCELPADATTITCADGVISPGLVDPHEHVTFGEAGPIEVGEQRWENRQDWRDGGLTTPSNTHGNDSVRWLEIRKVIGGTTTIVGSGGVAGFVRNADRSGMDEGAGLPVVDYETFPLGDSDGNYHADCAWNYGTDAYAVSQGEATVTHVAEGIDAYAAEEFRCLSDAVAGGQDVTEENVAHFHAIGLHTLDYDRMVREGTTLVWSPRSNLQLYGDTARVATFAALGGRIALGSDWVVTGSIHPGRELACADQHNRDHLDGAFTDRALWAMATENAALAIGAEARVGALEAGRLADIAVYDGSGATESPWRAVIGADAQDVALVVRGGVPLYGEPDAVEALGRTCEALTVCETPRAICAEQEVGMTYAALEALVPDNYPTFFCDGPPIGEPTCVPARPDAYTGVASADDADGDGLLDTVDLCPAVFDPVRPIDEGAQPDLDADGLGDACDPDPVPADLDGDGVDNGADNCPYDANADQADADTDAHGDACDACPDTPNPGTVCPPS